MDPVSPSDRLVRLLRQRLEDRAKASAAKAKTVSHIQPRSPDTARILASQIVHGGADDAQVGRLLVEQLLAEQLGPKLVNDARFQQVVDEVTKIMMADDVAQKLMGEALGGLRAQEL